MAFVFDSTFGGASANSYVSVEDADDYFGGHPDGSLWEALTQLQKEQYLVRSTTRLDYERFGGRREAIEQALQWPRTWIIDRNHEQHEDYMDFKDGNYYQDPNILPREMGVATYQLALNYIEEKSGLYSVTRRDQDRMSRKKVGPLDKTLRKASEAQLPNEVTRALTAIGPNGWLGNQPMRLVR